MHGVPAGGRLRCERHAAEEAGYLLCCELQACAAVDVRNAHIPLLALQIWARCTAKPIRVQDHAMGVQQPALFTFLVVKQRRRILPIYQDRCISRH